MFGFDAPGKTAYGQILDGAGNSTFLSVVTGAFIFTGISPVLADVRASTTGVFVLSGNAMTSFASIAQGPNDAGVFSIVGNNVPLVLRSGPWTSVPIQVEIWSPPN